MPKDYKALYENERARRRLAEGKLAAVSKKVESMQKNLDEAQKAMREMAVLMAAMGFPGVPITAAAAISKTSHERQKPKLPAHSRS